MELLAERVGGGVALFEVEDGGGVGGDGIGPDDAGLIVMRLDQRADEAGDADAIAAHFGDDRLAILAGDGEAHGGAVFGAEIEDVADLDAAAFAPTFGGEGFEGCCVVHFVGGGVHGGDLVEAGFQGGDVVVIGDGGGPVGGFEGAVEEDGTFAGFGQDDEFMGEIAADGAGIGAHGHGFEAQALEGAQIGEEHLAVAVLGGFGGDVEGIGVLHQEFAAAHDAEARAHLVTEFPLDVVEVARQVAVAFGVGAEDVGDHFLIGRAIEHFAVMAVDEAEHFLAIAVIAAGLAPELGGLDGGHQHFLRPCPVLLLAHDLADALEDAPAERQPGVDAGGGLPHQAGAEHEAMRDDGRLGRGFLECGQEGAGEAQGEGPFGWQPHPRAPGRHRKGAHSLRRRSNITAVQHRFQQDSCLIGPFWLQKLLCSAAGLG